MHQQKEHTMRPESIQDFIHRVELPSRYLGSEVNRIKKDPKQVKLKFLLAFPDLYEIGTSHFGIQILYHLINREPDLMAERVFAPARDMEAKLREYGLPLSSLESEIPMNRFDIIGFSLLYEMNYTNVLGMLSLAGLPFLAKERGDESPVIIAGGPCTSNPEPMADFFDAMVIGDGEGVVPELTRSWLQWKKEDGGRKALLLERWAKIEGVYIPGFYEASYDAACFQRLSIKANARGIAPETVRRAIIPELKEEDFPDRPIVAFGKPIHDRLRVEVARGCTRGCRFCQAGMIYRPVRERSVSQLMSLTKRSLAATGYEDISLLSLSTGDYSQIVPLMQALMARCERDKIAVSFPSLRAGTMSPEMMALVKKVRKTGFTMAVEAGSQRLRDVINKNIEREDILSMVEDAFRLGWQVIKLYFMIGLPGERQEDLDALVELVKEIHKIRGPKGRRGKINVSVNTFIPKSHTPFQWAGQLSVEESRNRIEDLKTALRLPGLQFKWQNPENSYLEGLWARGDRRFSKLLLAAYEKGCRFDGWSDQFRYDKWVEAIKEAGVDDAFFVIRKRDLEEPMPWEHIDSRVERNFLKTEWEKAEEEALTLDCRKNPCSACGVCDHKTMRPKISSSDEAGEKNSSEKGDLQQEFYKVMTVFYSRRDQARFFGHLELMNIFLRAIRRVQIPVAYSQGFHPMPKISFDDPLPLGYESMRESFRVRVPAHVKPDMVIQKLNSELPQGLKITDCLLDNHRPKGIFSRIESYEITLPGARFNEELLNRFMKEEKVIFRRTNRKGKTIETDLKKGVRFLKLVTPEKIQMVVSTDGGSVLRPGYVLEGIFQLSEEIIKDARIIKTETTYA